MNGLLVKPGAFEDLGDAILKLLHDKDLARTMGKHGRETVEKRFSQEKMIKETIDLYCRLLSGI